MQQTFEEYYHHNVNYFNKEINNLIQYEGIYIDRLSFFKKRYTAYIEHWIDCYGMDTVKTVDMR